MAPIGEPTQQQPVAATTRAHLVALMKDDLQDPGLEGPLLRIETMPVAPRGKAGFLSNILRMAGWGEAACHPGHHRHHRIQLSGELLHREHSLGSLSCDHTHASPPMITTR